MSHSRQCGGVFVLKRWVKKLLRVQIGPKDLPANAGGCLDWNGELRRHTPGPVEPVPDVLLPQADLAGQAALAAGQIDRLFQCF